MLERLLLCPVISGTVKLVGRYGLHEALLLRRAPALWASALGVGSDEIQLQYRLVAEVESPEMAHLRSVVRGAAMVSCC